MYSDSGTTRLLIVLRRIARVARAQVSAVFVPRGAGLALVAQIGIDQPALDVVNACWFRNQSDLRAGRTVRFSGAYLWPLFDGPQVAALIYLDRVTPDFPDQHTRDLAALVALRAPRCGKPSALEALAGASYRPGDILAQLERDRLVMALREHRGNVSDVAHVLGVCRDTVYKLAREAVPMVDIDEFRPRRRPRPARPRRV